MQRTHLIALLIGVVTVATIATDASAMYHPSMGRFLSRDPGGGHGMRAGAGGPAVVGEFVQRDPTTQYADGLNLYQYVRSLPVSTADPFGLAGEDIQFITSLVKKYGLSPEGRRFLHETLRGMKASGGMVSKAAADAEAATIASMAGKFVVRGLGIFFIVLTMESTADAAEIPPPTPEDIAFKIALDECEKCVCEKIHWKRTDVRVYDEGTERYGFFSARDYIFSWWEVGAILERVIETKEFDVMSRRDCIDTCKELPRQEGKETERNWDDSRFFEGELWRSVWQPPQVKEWFLYEMQEQCRHNNEYTKRYYSRS